MSKRKIVMLLGMLLMTVATLISTTYAFVIMNQAVDVDDFDFEFDVQNGILISLDGENFQSGITLDMMKEEILKRTGKKYDEVKYEGVTIKEDNDGKLTYNGDGSLVMIKDHLKADPDKEDYYLHEMVNAEKDDYLTFDLYFKLVGDVNKDIDYKLRLYDTTSVSGKGAKVVPLLADLTDKDGVVHGPTRDIKTISVDPVDSMRFAVTSKDGDGYKTAIYEPTLGLASSAIEGRTENIYNKDRNAMYTYYNSLNPFEVFTEAAKDGDAFDTHKIYEGINYSNEAIGSFEYDDTKAEFKVMKVTLTVWLEGWDADCFVGIPKDLMQFKVKFAFELFQ